MTVATNMAVLGRLENPRRLPSFGHQVSSLLKTKEATNIEITTDAEKSTTKTPDIEFEE